MRFISKLLTMVLVATLFLTFTTITQSKADSYPESAITVLTAFNPGGGSDVSHRIVAKYSEDLIPEPLAITYKPGAGGEMGWTALSNAKPDGYFIGGIDMPHIVLQPMVREEEQAGYKTEELAPICGLVRDPSVIMVHQDSKWKNLEQFMEHVRKNPGEVTAATVGKLTGDHIFLEMFEFATELDLAQVPYSGGGKAIPALMGKQVDCYFGSFNSYFRMEDARALAIATNEPYELDPSIPTIKEEGIDIQFEKRRGLAAPEGTPKDRIQYLEEKFSQMSKKSGYKEDTKDVGLMPSFLTSDEFDDYIQKEQKKMREVLNEMGFFE